MLLFIYLVFLFYSIFLFFGFWCSLFHWFYNFVVPKPFSSNVLIVVLTSFICCLSLKGAFFPLWFLIGFARFHAFIYLFGFSVLLNIFIFWLLVFFVPLVL
jgi:hypothetical protein